MTSDSIVGPVLNFLLLGLWRRNPQGRGNHPPTPGSGSLVRDETGRDSRSGPQGVDTVFHLYSVTPTPLTFTPNSYPRLVPEPYRRPFPWRVSPRPRPDPGSSSPRHPVSLLYDSWFHWFHHGGRVGDRHVLERYVPTNKDMFWYKDKMCFLWGGKGECGRGIGTPRRGSSSPDFLRGGGSGIEDGRDRPGRTHGDISFIYSSESVLDTTWSVLDTTWSV